MTITAATAVAASPRLPADSNAAPEAAESETGSGFTQVFAALLGGADGPPSDVALDQLAADVSAEVTRADVRSSTEDAITDALTEPTGDAPLPVVPLRVLALPSVDKPAVPTELTAVPPEMEAFQTETGVNEVIEAMRTAERGDAPVSSPIPTAPSMLSGLSPVAAAVTSATRAAATTAASWAPMAATARTDASTTTATPTAPDAAAPRASEPPSRAWSMILSNQQAFASNSAANQSTAGQLPVTPASVELAVAGQESGGEGLMELTGPTSVTLAREAARTAPATVSAALSAHVQQEPEAFAQQLGLRLATWAREGISQATLRINPEQLGPIDVRIQLQGQQVSVDFQARHSQTVDLIDSLMPRLAQAFDLQGLRLDDARVSSMNASDSAAFSAGQQGRQESAFQMGQGQGRSGSPDGRPKSSSAGDTADRALVPENVVHVPTASSLGRVDYYA